MIVGSPETASLAVDADKHLIQVSSPLGVLASRPLLPRMKFCGKGRIGPGPAGPDVSMADVDAPFVEQIFELAQG